MTLIDYLRIVWKRLWLIALCVTIATTSAYVFSKRATPTYASTTTILLGQTALDTQSPSYDLLMAVQQQARTYAQLLTKTSILTKVITNLNLNENSQQLSTHIDVKAVLNTQLIEVTVSNSDPALAASIANELIVVFRQQNAERRTINYADSRQHLNHELNQIDTDIGQTQAQLDRMGSQTGVGDVEKRQQLKTLLDQQKTNRSVIVNSLSTLRLDEAQGEDDLSVIEQAQIPLIPVGPRVLLNTAIAALISAILAIAIVLFVGLLEQTVGSQSKEAAPELPLLATIPPSNDLDSLTQLAVVAQPLSQASETYYMLRSRIEFAALKSPIQTLLITGFDTQNSSDAVAANLATTFAQDGKRTILVDGDIDHPSLYLFFDSVPRSGIQTATKQLRIDAIEDHLIGVHELEDHLTQTDIANLYLLSNVLALDPSKHVLNSDTLIDHIQTLRATFDMVVWLAPPSLHEKLLIEGDLFDAAIVVGSPTKEQPTTSTALKQWPSSYKSRLLGMVYAQVANNKGNILHRILSDFSQWENTSVSEVAD